MTTKVFIKTYGCQMNVYDSEKILSVLSDSLPVELTDDDTQADMLLMNTCSIRAKAQEKVFSELGRWKKLKAKRPEIIIGVGGCVASQEGPLIAKRAPYVDIVFGPQTIHRLPELLKKNKRNKKTVIDISFPKIEKFDSLPEPKAEGPSAYVTIMEGCSKYCTYCVVPYTRGEEISRPFDDVLSEVASLAEQGVCEIHLLGQNVNDYRGLMHNGQYANLALLIHYVAAISDVKRIRFTTSHPNAFSDSLIQAFKEEPKLVNHLHLPIQSGSDRILSAMKRQYTALEFKSKIRRLREVRPDISLSSDFIVGFPGETQADFQKTMDIIHEIQFDHSFSFIYSPRPGTPAAELPDPVTEAEKKDRLHTLQAALSTYEQAISQKMLGTIQPVLVLGPSKRNPAAFSARTENNRVVHFEGQDRHIGSILPVKIIGVKPFSLLGTCTLHS